MPLTAGEAIALALDPTHLALRAGITPDPWQARLLRSRTRQVILNCSRQSGKSTVAALLAVDELLHRAPALVLLLAPALRQAQELHRTVRRILSALGGLVPHIVAESALALELANGSRVVVLPGTENTVRGFASVALLVVDEASRIDDALYGAIRPMLAVSRGRMILLSTPFGRRGTFYETWVNAGPDWLRIRLPASQCPRIDPAWLEQERRALPGYVFMQEYECEFVDAVAQVFGSDLVRRAITDRVRPLFPMLERAS